MLLTDLFKQEPLYIIRSIEYFIDLPSYFNENNFENVVINASNRKQVKFLSYLLANEKVISTIKFVFPKSVIRFSRKFFDRISKKKEGQNSKIYTPENIQFVQQFFVREENYVAEMFNKTKIQLGDGTPFELDY